MPLPSERDSWRDASGRLTRRTLLIRGVPLLIGGIIIYLALAEAIARYAGLSMWEAPTTSNALALARAEGSAGLIVVAVLAWPAAALIIRRLHDIGLSGRWLALMASGEILNSVALATGIAGTPAAPTTIGTAVGLLALAGGLSFIPLVLWPGQAGANSFGPQPTA